MKDNDKEMFPQFSIISWDSSYCNIDNHNLRYIQIKIHFIRYINKINCVLFSSTEHNGYHLLNHVLFYFLFYKLVYNNLLDFFFTAYLHRDLLEVNCAPSSRPNKKKKIRNYTREKNEQWAAVIMNVI